MKIAFSIYRRRSDNIKVMDIKDNFKCEMHSDKSMHPHAISRVIDMEVNSNNKKHRKNKKTSCIYHLNMITYKTVTQDE